MGPDGDDDDDAETKPLPATNVSHVDFDKTKPYSQKQIGDGPSQATARNITKTNQFKHSSTVGENNVHVFNGKSGSSKAKNVDSENNIGDKSKIRTQSRINDSDQKQAETNPKPPKKHKRDVHF